MSSFEKSRTKKKMKRETAKKKRAKKKKTTRATQSDHRVRPVVCLSFLLSEHRHNKSRQAQTLERGASHAAIIVRHNDQFKHRDIREFNLIFLDFVYRARGLKFHCWRTISRNERPPSGDHRKTNSWVRFISVSSKTSAMRVSLCG